MFIMCFINPDVFSEIGQKGDHVDKRLKFMYHMKETVKKVDVSMWRVRNLTQSSSSFTINKTFFSWVFPHFLYGAPIWIFKS